MDLERLGAVLRERREALGVPAAEIARRVGVSPTYVWMIEHARRRGSGEPSRPSRSVLERWVRALGIEDRYAQQVLRLAGYGDEGSRRESARVAQRPLIEPAAPAPGPEMLDNLFATPVRMEVPRELRESVLLEDASEALQRAAERGRWQEAADLLGSFLDWLRHHVDREA